MSVNFMQYDCLSAPFEFENTQFSWWLDRNQKMRTFWTGNETIVTSFNSANEHLCQCAIDGNCIDPAEPCNCDAMVPTLQFDEGVDIDM